MQATLKRVISVLWTVLVVVSVILLLLFALVAVMVLPKMRASAMYIKQKAQLHCLDAAIELFRNESNSYPPSDADDAIGKSYCGAMKLAEALMGRDLRGFHSQSAFRSDGLHPNTLAPLYPANPAPDDRKARMGPYMASEWANAWRLADVYGKGKTGPFREDVYVLCDTFERKRPGGQKTGMPILYYREDRPGDPNNIYDSADNQALLALGIPGHPGKTHPLIDPNRFRLHTQDDRHAASARPYSYILISAGRDGLYGTADDILNFPTWKYREK